MNKRSFNFLSAAGSNFAGAAASIFNAIEACNDVYDIGDAKGMAGKFDLSLAVSKFERALRYFYAFLDGEKIDIKSLKDVDVCDKTMY